MVPSIVQSRARLRRSRAAVVALGFAVLGLTTGPGRLDAQAGRITGTVVEAKSGRPIAAATVRVEETDIGTTTDVRGNFTLNGVTGTKRIVVRAVGYQPKTVDATAGDPPLRIGLEELAVKLDELVVTGTVGEATARSLGNSIGKINIAATTEIAPPTKLQDMLSVNVPGVRVLRASGAIGSGGITRIRGSGSLSLSNEPLLYIDGVRVYNEAAVNSAAFQTFSGESPSRINDLNPEEIESIEIIKGPSAATIYGTEASNGVIQVITKRGRSGRTQVEAHFGAGVSWLENPEGRYPSDYYQDFDGTVKEFNVLRFNESRGYPNVFQNGMPKNAGASISGGSDRLSYFFGADYNRDEGYLSYGWQNKYNARANLSYRSADDKFKVDVSLGAIRSKTNSQQGFQPITTSIVWACNFNACRPDPADPEHTGYNGPGHGWQFYRPEDYSDIHAFDNIDRTTFSVTVTHRPFVWLRHHITVGPDFTNNASDNLIDRHFDDRRPFFSSSNGERDVLESRATYLTIDYGISADWNVRKNLVSTTSAGAQYYDKQLATQFGQGLIFAIPGSGDINGAAQRTATESFLENKTFGIFVQEQVAWNNRMFFTAALRGDDNSAFGKSYSAVYYPKFSFSWVLSEEKFLAGKDWLPQLKLRSAWGRAGQQPEVFSAIRTYQAKVGTGGSGQVTPQNFGNANLKPEVGQEFEVGIDAGLLKQRVGLELTYYIKKINDAILSVPLSPSGGFPGSEFVNIGQTQNKGVEAAVDLSALNSPNLGLDLRFTYAHNNSKITSMGGLPPSIVSFAQQFDVEGFAPGSFFLKKVVSSDVVRPAGQVPYGTNVMCEGGTDLGAGDGSVVPCDNAPRIYAGDLIPKWSGSASATVTIYKRLRLLALVDYAGGHKADVGDVGAAHMFFLNTRAVLTGDDPILSGYYGLSRQGYAGASDAAGLFNAGFARLRTVSATYEFPAKYSHWLGASRSVLTVSGENLAFVWRAQTESFGVKWIDPEIRPNFTGDQGHNGYVQESFPQATRVRVELRLTF